VKGIAVRASYFAIGVVHAALAISAFKLLSGDASGASDGDSTHGWTVELMAQPYGRWLVGIVGAVVCGRGVFHMYRAFTLKFREKLQLAEMSATEEKWALRLGRMGYGARGFVFTIIGAFLIVAAIRRSSKPSTHWLILRSSASRAARSSSKVSNRIASSLSGA